MTCESFDRRLTMDICLDHAPRRQDHLFARIRRFPFVKKIDAFFQSAGYFALLGLLTVLCNAFSLELPVYTIFILIGVYVCFFGQDFLPIVPLVPCCYIAPYISNNPGAFDTSVFYIGYGGGYILILAAIFAACVIFRLALDPELGRSAFFRTPRKMLSGMLALGCAYLLAGAGSGHYFDHGTGNIVFALVQFLSIFALYFIFTGTIRWNEAPKHYFSMTGLMVGLVLVAEIIVMYIITGPFSTGRLDRNVLFTGWGNYNCMGGLLAMMIPFAFHMAVVRRPSWRYSLCGVLFLIGVIMTCSRTAIVTGIFIYFLSFVVLCLRSRNRRSTVIINVTLFGGLLLYMLLFQLDILVEYLEIFTIKRSIGSRFDGFVAGIQQFLDYPILGGSFYAVDYVLEEWSTVQNFTSFFPGLWHNTVIQIAASCGIVGLAAYGWHRIQTVKLILKMPSTENLFIGLSIAAMLVASLFDCHIFNIGPALFYSMALAFAEKNDPQTV